MSFPLGAGARFPGRIVLIPKGVYPSWISRKIMGWDDMGWGHFSTNYRTNSFGGAGVIWR